MGDEGVVYSCQSFIAYAESYGRAANFVARLPRLLHTAPIGALAFAGFYVAEAAAQSSRNCTTNYDSRGRVVSRYCS